MTNKERTTGDNLLTELTREKLNELFGVPTRQKTEPYNSMTIKQLIKAQKANENIWWCKPCNDFHTSSWNHMRSFVTYTRKNRTKWVDEHINTQKLLIKMEEE